MLKLATLLQNPGEPEIESQYKQPQVLKDLGYNGLVLYATTALSGIGSPEDVADREMSRWLAQQMDEAARRVDEAVDVGLDAYISYDLLVLPTSYVERHQREVCCKGSISTLCPASEQAFRKSMAALEALIHRMPKITGVVLRVGDTDANRLPHLTGNDLYTPHCAGCSRLGRADRVVTAIEYAYEQVVQNLNRRLVVRAWNVRPSGFHDSSELAKRIVERLPGSATEDRLILSFKFTQTDFWRYQPWNQPSLICGDYQRGGRPILYELQCQREFEGKGGVPNWQPPLWRDGLPESDADERGGLAALAGRVNLAGLWAWARGGGWGGPFVKDEAWIDANVFAVPVLADQPSADPAELARQWVRDRLEITDTEAEQAVVAVLQDSAEAARLAFYFEPFARAKANHWHPAADWVGDDQLNADGAWRIIQRTEDRHLDAIVSDKDRAVDIIDRCRHTLQTIAGDREHPRLEPLINTLIYAESLYAAMRDLTAGLVAYRRFQDTGHRDHADQARGRLLAAQSAWNHHAGRHAMLPGTATPFREQGFWELTQRVLDEVG